MFALSHQKWRIFAVLVSIFLQTVLSLRASVPSDVDDVSPHYRRSALPDLYEASVIELQVSAFALRRTWARGSWHRWGH